MRRTPIVSAATMTGPAPTLISCQVIDAEGNPVAGARVYFTRGPGSFPDVAALTDDQGAVLLAAPAPGSYELQAAADGYVAGNAEVTALAGATISCRIVLHTA